MLLARRLWAKLLTFSSFCRYACFLWGECELNSYHLVDIHSSHSPHKKHAYLQNDENVRSLAHSLLTRSMNIIQNDVKVRSLAPHQKHEILQIHETVRILAQSPGWHILLWCVCVWGGGILGWVDIHLRFLYHKGPGAHFFSGDVKWPEHPNISSKTAIYATIFGRPRQKGPKQHQKGPRRRQTFFL